MIISPRFLCLLLFSFHLTVGNEDASIPEKRQVTYKLIPVIIPPYSQYPAQQSVYPGYGYGNPYPIQANNLFTYPQYGNIYQGNIFPYQQGLQLNVPTRIIDVDDKNYIQIPKSFSITQDNSKSDENKKYPIKFVKSSYATTKPLTITINRNPGQDSVRNYNFQNGELMDDKVKINSNENSKPKRKNGKKIERQNVPTSTKFPETSTEVWKKL